jgi:aryl-alcohol dehydrogenase-like predicted oxidoreductase
MPLPPLHTIDWDGKPTPRLGFGCASMMGRVGRRDSLHALHAAWDAGITLFDTARSYGYGEGEALLGSFLSASSRRDKAIVITKFGVPVYPMPRWKAAAKPLVRSALRLLPSARSLVRSHLTADHPPHTYNIRTLRSSLEESLRQLRTDHVDVLLAHEAPATLAAQDDLLSELQLLIDQGKVRRTGIACSRADAAPLATSAPATLSVLEYPAWHLADWPQVVPLHRRLIANHPFGGAVYAKRVAEALSLMTESPLCDAMLREKLRGDIHTRLAEFWFTRARQVSSPHIIVTSMLHPAHLQANLLAIDSDRFSAHDIAAIQQWISSERLLS